MNISTRFDSIGDRILFYAGVGALLIAEFFVANLANVQAQATPSDTTPPTISSVTVTDIGYFTATINWTTNEPAMGQVAFCTTYLVGCANNTPIVSEFTTQHVINLSGLTPGTYYYIWIKAFDASQNLRTYYRTFRTVNSTTITPGPTPTPTTSITPTPTPGADRTPPIISSVIVSGVTPFAANIAWMTNEPADGQIAFCTFYIIGCANATPLVADFTAEHIINLSGLNPGTYYYMWIKSKDAAGNLRTYYRSFRTATYVPGQTPTPTPTQTMCAPPPCAVPPIGCTIRGGNMCDPGNYCILVCPNTSPTPTPGADRIAPIISSVTVTNVTSFYASINWVTNEPADAQIAFCTTYLVGCANNTPLVAELATMHVINLSGLTPGTYYYIWIKSKDASGNLRTFYRTFRTVNSTTITPGPTPTPTTSISPTPTPGADITPPVISSVTVTGITPFAASINWMTNEVADGQVAFCTTYLVGCANNTPIVPGTMGHNIFLSGLTPGTYYYIWIKSRDTAGNLRTFYRTFRTSTGTI